MIATLIVACAWCPAQVSAGVKQAPDVEGPLERGERVCDSDRDDVLGLRIATCHYDFFVDPALDGDPDHTYTADWIQIALEPLNGHYVAGARAGSASGTRASSREPRRDAPGRVETPCSYASQLQTKRSDP